MKRLKRKISWEKIFRHRKIKAFCKREKMTAEYVNLMYPREDKEKILLEIWGKRIAVAAVLFAAVIFSAAYSCLSVPEQTILRDGKYVTRGENDEKMALTVVGTAGEETWEKSMTIEVKEREFSEREKERLSEQTKEYVNKTLPGENHSLLEVSEPLVFADAVPDTGITLEWIYDDRYIRENGALRQSAIPDGGEKTEVLCKARWKNWEKTYYFTLCLKRRQLSVQEAAEKDIKRAVKEVMVKQADKEVVELPLHVGETKVQYRTGEGDRDYTLLFISLFAFVVVPLYLFQKQRKGLKERENQLIFDYPEFVNRVMLLLSAGLTVRKAMERMAGEYGNGRQNGESVHYVYEEVSVMVQKMRDGVSEGRAIEQFGRRCGLLPYLRFTSVITQNLKKGAEGIIDILEQESLEAFEKRKERILQLGEMAGTKLLFPMMIMLGLVMGMIMVPAFMTM